MTPTPADRAAAQAIVDAWFTSNGSYNTEFGPKSVWHQDLTNRIAQALAAQREWDAKVAEANACNVQCLHDECGAQRIVAQAIRQGEGRLATAERDGDELTEALAVLCELGSPEEEMPGDTLLSIPVPERIRRLHQHAEAAVIEVKRSHAELLEEAKLAEAALSEARGLLERCHDQIPMGPSSLYDEVKAWLAGEGRR